MTGEIAAEPDARRTRSATGGRSGLPAGPPLPTFAQAAIWALRPLDLMDRCAERYGETFTLRVRRGRPWVLITHPDHVKLVFTNRPDADVARAPAKQTRCWIRCSAPGSVMLLDEPQPPRDRRRLLPSFHGDLHARLRRDDGSRRRRDARSAAGHSASRSPCGRECKRSVSTS